MLSVAIALGSDHGSYIGLETMKDVAEYFADETLKIGNLVHKVCRSNDPVDRWDPHGQRDIADGLFVSAIRWCKSQGGNPLIEMGLHADAKAMRIAKLVAGGETVLINSVGGYCTLSAMERSTVHEIVSIESGSINEKQTVFLTDNTTYLNLENDDELEDTVLAYMATKDVAFSYILNLHKHAVDDLVKIFNDFQEKGGSIVYVYTTGMNVPQMYEYSEAIIKSGLKFVEFDFNSGYSDEHEAVVEYLQTNGVTVKILRQ